MNPDKLKKLEDKLYSQTPVFGKGWRKEAAKELAEDSSPEAVEILAQAVINSNDEQVKNIAMEAFNHLNRKASVDAFCQIWAQTRHPKLGQLIKQRGWIASTPIELRVLTALKVGQPKWLGKGGKEIVTPLLKAFDDPDPDVVEHAKKMAISLKNEEAKAEVCRLAIEENQAIALEVLVSAEYMPEGNIEKPLFYFLSQQWDKYQSSDPEGTILAEIYTQSPPEQRQRLENVAQKAGRMEWVWWGFTGHNGEKIAQMVDDDWKTILKFLVAHEYYQEMWQLSNKAPALWSRRILLKLHKHQWLPSEEKEQHQCHKLIELAQKCIVAKPPLGKLLKAQTTLTGHESGIYDLQISRDDQLVASSGDKTVKLWQLPEGNLIKSLEGHTDIVLCLTISPEVNLLATGSRDKRVYLWELPSGKPLDILSGHSASVYTLAISPDGKLLASGSMDKTIKLWSLPFGQHKATLTGHTREIECLAISPDNQILVSGGGWEDNTIRLWKLPQGEYITTLTGHTDTINSLVITPDSKLLISSSLDNSIRLWKLPEGEHLATLEGHNASVYSLALSVDSTLLASGGGEGDIRLWQLPDGKPLGTCIGHIAPPYSLVITPDKRFLFSGSLDKTLRLWQLPEGKPVATFCSHSSSLNCLDINSDGDLLVSGSWDKTVIIWQSELIRLSRLPIEQISDADKEWLQQVYQNGEFTPHEQPWLEFILELTKMSNEL